ncbi:hypothetical protein [Brucella sp. LJL56]
MKDHSVGFARGAVSPAGAADFDPVRFIGCDAYIKSQRFYDCVAVIRSSSEKRLNIGPIGDVAVAASEFLESFI